MPDVVPLRIKITKNADGTLNYPDFKGQLSVFQTPDYRAPELYTDRTSDCKSDDAHSPLGQMWGLKLVDQAFAQQALTAFPDRVSVLTEAELVDFWEQRVKARMPVQVRAPEELRAMVDELALRREMGQDDSAPEVIALKAEMAKALDPDDPTPGVTKQRDKTWADAKRIMGVTVISVVTP
jgi:hypothetical protein